MTFEVFTGSPWAPDPRFLMKFTGNLRNGKNALNRKSVSERLASNVLNIIILPYKKEFLKNIYPSAHCRENGATPEKRVFP